MRYGCAFVKISTQDGGKLKFFFLHLLGIVLLHTLVSCHNLFRLLYSIHTHTHTRKQCKMCNYPFYAVEGKVMHTHYKLHKTHHFIRINKRPNLIGHSYTFSIFRRSQRNYWNCFQCNSKSKSITRIFHWHRFPRDFLLNSVSLLFFV